MSTKLPLQMATTDPAVHATRQRRAILIAVCIALMAVISSASWLNVAQRQVSLAVGASQSEVLWIINIYAGRRRRRHHLERGLCDRRER